MEGLRRSLAACFPWFTGILKSDTHQPSGVQESTLRNSFLFALLLFWISKIIKKWMVVGDMKGSWGKQSQYAVGDSLQMAKWLLEVYGNISHMLFTFSWCTLGSKKKCRTIEPRGSEQHQIWPQLMALKDTIISILASYKARLVMSSKDSVWVLWGLCLNVQDSWSLIIPIIKHIIKILIALCFYDNSSV